MIKQIIQKDRELRIGKNLRGKVILASKCQQDDLKKELEEKHGYKTEGELTHLYGMVIINSEDEIIRL